MTHREVIAWNRTAARPFLRFTLPLINEKETLLLVASALGHSLLRIEEAARDLGVIRTRGEWRFPPPTVNAELLAEAFLPPDLPERPEPTPGPYDWDGIRAG